MPGRNVSRLSRRLAGRVVGRFDGLAASTAATVREVGINKTERQAGKAQRGRTSERGERI